MKDAEKTSRVDGDLETSGKARINSQLSTEPSMAYHSLDASSGSETAAPRA